MKGVGVEQAQPRAQAVPYDERHAGQDDELIEPGRDLRMRIPLRQLVPGAALRDDRAKCEYMRMFFGCRSVDEVRAVSCLRSSAGPG
jgi:hypothetical protein